jgi:CBS domain containing-hemolysin-like protein
MLDVALIVALLAANAFFVAVEFALVKARGFRIEALAADGRFGAKITVHIHQRLESYLAACQLGITMASLALGWVGEPAVESLLHPILEPMDLSPSVTHTIAFVVGFIVFSSLHIVVGEQVPKTYAIREPEPVALWCAYPLHAFYICAYPLNRLLTMATSSILRLMGVKEASHEEVLSGEDFQALARKSGEHGAIASDKATMVANLFAFDHRAVNRVMIPRGDVVFLDVAAGTAHNVAILRESNHSRFPLINGDPNRPIGVILSKEIYAASLGGGDDPWANINSFARSPVVVPESLRLPELFDTMRERRTHMAFVVDEYGDFVGLVTLEDLLEEIVGDISDETDDVAHGLATPTGEGCWEASGLMSLTDVRRDLGLTVPSDLDANTLSGLMMQRIGRMPVVGDAVEEEGHRIEVIAMAERHVGRVLVEVVSGEDSTPVEDERNDSKT